MSEFKAVYCRVPELPLFPARLKIDKVEEVIHADSIKDAYEWAKCDKHKGFELVGIVKI